MCLKKTGVETGVDYEERRKLIREVLPAAEAAQNRMLAPQLHPNAPSSYACLAK